jgi:N-acetylmuramoyl-L-alanine amidase
LRFVPKSVSPAGAKAVASAVRKEREAEIQRIEDSTRAAQSPAPNDVQRLFASALGKAVSEVPGSGTASGGSRVWKLDRVVIDAGHGGWDTGAVGRAGFQEKDLALILALRVGRLLEEKLGVEVIYTRDDDRFIPVAERGRIANEARGKLFISIHANQASDSRASGTETYFLGTHRTDSARVVMNRENKVVQLEKDRNFYDQYDNAGSVQKALARSAFMKNSQYLADAVQRQFTDVVGRKNRGVKQAGFYVLFGASMPSVLIELGFLSNPREEAFLSSFEGQSSMASAIFRAVQDYKLEYEKSLRVAAE